MSHLAFRWHLGDKVCFRIVEYTDSVEPQVKSYGATIKQEFRLLYNLNSIIKIYFNFVRSM